MPSPSLDPVGDDDPNVARRRENTYLANADKVARMPEDDGTPTLDVFDEHGMFDGDKAASIYEEARGWPPEQKAALLNWLRATQTRVDVRAKYRNAAELAAGINPLFKITPAIDTIAVSIEQVLRRRANLLVSMPPQEGKSSLCSVWTPLRALQINPNRRIILVTYASSLAEDHSRACRDLIARHGSDVLDSITGLPVADRLGLKITPGASKVNSWKVEGGNGGFTAVGIGGTITGRPADLLIIDDPYKNMMEADSASYRRKVDEWFNSVAQTRLAPGASIVLIQTRWHPEDLSGRIVATERALPVDQKSWRHINIPAISEAGIPDALGRPPGVPMESARDGFDDDGNPVKRDFARTRAAVGERVWYALYQGSPRVPSGGLFLRKWFEPRCPEAPEAPLATVVGVDPADSGEGDETGIVAASLDTDGKVILTEDWSEQMTAEKWSRRAVELALVTGAREIALEAYSAAKTYKMVLERAYQEIHQQTVARYQRGEELLPVEQRALTTVPPFVIHLWRGVGDDVGRSALLRQQMELGNCRVVEGAMDVFENQAADWQAGQHQPDRVAAAVIAHARLFALGRGRMEITAPVDGRTADAPSWLRRRIGDL